MLEIELFLDPCSTEMFLFEQLNIFFIQDLSRVIKNYLVLPFKEDFSSLLKCEGEVCLTHKMQFLQINDELICEGSQTQQIYCLMCHYDNIFAQDYENLPQDIIFKILHTIQDIKLCHFPLTCIRFWSRSNMFGKTHYSEQISRVKMQTDFGTHVDGFLVHDSFYPAYWFLNPGTNELEDFIKRTWRLSSLKPLKRKRQKILEIAHS